MQRNSLIAGVPAFYLSAFFFFVVLLLAASSVISFASCSARSLRKRRTDELFNCLSAFSLSSPWPSKGARAFAQLRLTQESNLNPGLEGTADLQVEKEALINAAGASPVYVQLLSVDWTSEPFAAPAAAGDTAAAGGDTAAAAGDTAAAAGDTAAAAGDTAAAKQQLVSTAAGAAGATEAAADVAAAAAAAAAATEGFTLLLQLSVPPQQKLQRQPSASDVFLEIILRIITPVAFLC
ncbi:hypothetical protein, conserved [Eimeria acervulina]|uniref:Uncharacterized protein n=1 Tax=Eimeria acervulina TaxID=5801 RepID=U6G956_EIMAC|nr:hypothetical protein, conserved [Eimeria acervulina]CDI76665.1 hypothetical protein, conserved [Eimeria acervulina]